MKIRFICGFILLLLLTAGGFAQDGPAWISAVEATVKKKEPAWKIKDKIDYTQNDSYILSLQSGNLTASIHIVAYREIANPEETFTGQITVFENLRGKNVTKTELANFGDEGYIWTGSKKGVYTTIKFRKSNVFVEIYAPTEKTARRFAQYVFEQLP